MCAVPRRTLVIGGARSGKSRHAEDLLPADAEVVYVATGRRRPGDDDWDRRLDKHRERRSPAWRTVEDGDVARVLRGHGAGGPVIVDDIGTWLTGVLDDMDAWGAGAAAATGRAGELIADLACAVRDHRGRLVVVTTEAGMGVVPGDPSGRLFRDLLGTANAALATVSDEVVLLVAGLPLRVK